MENVQSQIAVVRATPGDLPALSELAAMIWRVVYPGIISEDQIEYMLELMYQVPTLEREMSEGVRFERIVAQGQAIGFAGWGPAAESNVCKLHKLYLHPVWQGRGIGTRVLQHVMSEAKAAGFTQMTLNVNKNNVLAIEAYKRSAFTIVGEVCDDIGGGFYMDDYIMAREI